MRAERVQDTRTRRWPLCGEPPHFAARLGREGVAVAGEAACSLGHAYAPPDGRARGVHASWSWDGDTLTAEVDPLGFFSLFYFADVRSVGVSPSLLQLIAAGASTAVDHRALAVFFRLGLFINDDTPFENIRVLPPGGRLTWRPGRVEVTGAPSVPVERRISRADAVDGFVDLTRQSMRRILQSWPGEFLLPLSGGRDSRHILLEMHHLGRLPKDCVTFHHTGDRPDAETLAAGAICARVGAAHTVLARPRPRARDALRTLTLTSFCADEHAQMMPLHDYFAVRPGAALDGIAGDVLSNPDESAEEFLHLARCGDFGGIARRMMEGHARVISRPAWGVGAGPIYSSGRDEEAVAYVGAAIAQFASAPDPYQAFWFWNRTRREIGFVSTAVLGSAEAVFCPYLDPELVEFGLSLPYAVTRDRQLHNEAMAKAYPACRDVPFHEGFPRPGRRPWQPLRTLRNAVDGLRLLLAAEPDRPARQIADLLRPPRDLHRAAGDTYRLYAACLQGLDAAKARRLLALSARLRPAPADPV
jgi:asparagine synthase (glutamine-hydrolysing)